MSRLKNLENREGDEVTDIVVDVDGKVGQKIEEIKNNKTNKSTMQYLVQFIGQSEEDATWMTKTELVNAKERMKEYENSFKKTKTS